MRVNFVEGRGLDPTTWKKGRGIEVRCKITSLGTSDFHGLILGGRALDCEAKGGLGFRPEAHGHVLSALGIVMPRTEDSSNARRDRAYPFVSNVVSIFDDPPSALSGETGDASYNFAASDDWREIKGEGEPQTLLVSEEPVTLQPDDVAWIPVRRLGFCPPDHMTEAVLPITVKGKATPEALPGLWETGQDQGMICVVAGPEGCVVEAGDALASLSPGAAVASGCSCGTIDMTFVEYHNRVCQACAAPEPCAVFSCRGCDKTEPVVFSGLQGCAACRPRKGNGWVAGVGLFFTSVVAAMTAATTSEVKSWDAVYHIQETPGAMEKLAEMAPTDYYYEKLLAGLLTRHPKADKHLLDHLVSLEAFLDKSIQAGFSYGCDKASVCKTEGKLLGHYVSRNGTRADGEAVQAIRGFAPLKEKLHIQQFCG